MKKKQINDVLNQEIKWCINSKGTAENESFAKGFLKGLRQAKRLISKIK